MDAKRVARALAAFSYNLHRFEVWSTPLQALDISCVARRLKLVKYHLIVQRGPVSRGFNARCGRRHYVLRWGTAVKSTAGWSACPTTLGWLSMAGEPRILLANLRSRRDTSTPCHLVIAAHYLYGSG